jgi:CHAT domain-containing protein
MTMQSLHDPRPSTPWILLGLLFILTALPTPGSAGELPHPELWSQAFPGAEWTHGRLSVEIPAPSGAVEASERPLALARLAVALQDDHETAATPATAHARGLFYLLAAGPARAVPFLEEAAEGKIAPAASDLAAAYLARAEEQNQPRDLALALEAAERAVELDGDLIPALINRSLVIEKLHLGRVAEDRLLNLQTIVADAEQGEIAQRLESLEMATPAAAWGEAQKSVEAAARAGDRIELERLTSDFVLETLDFALGELLDRWATVVQEESHSEAEEALSLLRPITAVLRDLGCDAILAESIAQLEAADPAASKAWAASYLKMKAGRDAPVSDDLQEPIEDLAAAGAELRAQGSPLAAYADFFLAQKQLYAQDYLGAFTGLTSLHQTISRERSRNLASRVARLLALIDLYAGNHGSALERLRDLETMLSEAPPSERPAGLDVLLAETLTTLGQVPEAWDHRLRALHKTNGTSAANLRLATLYEAVAALQQAGLYRASFWAAREAVLTAEAVENAPALLFEGLRLQGRARYLRGQVTEGEADFGAAARRAEEVEDEKLRGRIQADLAADEGRLLLEIEPADAVARLTSALEGYGKIGYTFHAPELYLLRGRAHEALARLPQATRDYNLAIDLRETIRGGLASAPQRRSYFDSVQRAFNGVMSFHVRTQGNSLRVLELSEQARGRTLLDLADPERSSWPEAPSGQELIAAVPSGVTLLEYVILEDRLLTLVVDGAGLRMHQKEIQADHLRERVESFVDRVRAGATLEEIRPQASELHDLLLQDVGTIAPEAPLVFVPDGVLFSLPFSLLFNRKSERLLIEDHPYAVAPSIAIFLRQLERLESFSTGEERSLLALANTRAVRHLDLGGLPAAAEEVEAIGRYYDRRLVLKDGDATVKNLMEQIQRFRILHVAAHAVSVPDLPELSSLALTPAAESSKDGLVGAAELSGLEWTGVELVVLSACRSAERYGRGREGVAGVARPFLKAGVPTVIASLWEVDDEATGRLMEQLHCRLARGEEAVGGLRAAQLAFWKQQKEHEQEVPAEWSAFESIGAVNSGFLVSEPCPSPSNLEP